MTKLATPKTTTRDPKAAKALTIPASRRPAAWIFTAYTV
jgi:hypothetical protein